MKHYQINLKSLYIEITNKCNFHCTTCYNSSSAENNLFLDYKIIEKMILECKSLSGEVIYFSGGEPLLHSKVWDMVDCCIENGISPFIVTNGSLLNEETILKVVKKKVPLQISLDGYDEQTNDAIRGQGSFSKVIRALSLLKKYDYSSPLRIRCTLNKINSNNLHNYVNLAKEFNAGELSFGWMAPLGRGNNCFEHIGITENEYYELYQKVNELKKQYDSTNLKIGQMELINCCPMLSNEQLPIDLNLRITPKGEVCLCQRMSVESEILGNINDNNLSTLLASDRLDNLLNRLFMRKTMITDKCKQCFISNFCSRGCPGLAFQKGNELELDEFCLPRKKLCAHVLFNHE